MSDKRGLTVTVSARAGACPCTTEPCGENSNRSQRARENPPNIFVNIMQRTLDALYASKICLLQKHFLLLHKFLETV